MLVLVLLIDVIFLCFMYMIFVYFVFFFFFQAKKAYEVLPWLLGSEIGLRERPCGVWGGSGGGRGGVWCVRGGGGGLGVEYA